MGNGDEGSERITITATKMEDGGEVVGEVGSHRAWDHTMETMGSDGDDEGVTTTTMKEASNTDTTETKNSHGEEPDPPRHRDDHEDGEEVGSHRTVQRVGSPSRQRTWKQKSRCTTKRSW